MAPAPLDGSSLLADYQAYVESFSSALLDDYVNRLPLQAEQPRRLGKEINDPVWGTISLFPAEVIMLDSPLFQRLRRLKQLGVAHLVYPSAHHTRFEHSVGACHQIGLIAGSINTHSGAILISEEQLRILRLAALSHDLGHGLMSHVSDNAVKRTSEVRALQSAFRDAVPEVGEVQLSEIAASMMVLSEPFNTLLQRAFVAEEKTCPADTARQIANMILGAPSSPGSPLLHELVTGPFDADKLDYLPRDAMFCGVPQVTDIPRMIQKIRGAKRALSELPSDVQEMLSEDPPRELLVIGLAPSGAQALDEVALAKSLMIDKVYRHHKVRAAEAMIASVLAEWQPLLATQPSLLPLTLTDDEFMALSETVLRATAKVQGADKLSDFERRVATGMDILQRFRDRRLFVRAYAFSSHLTQDPAAEDAGSVRQPKEAVTRAFRNHDEARVNFAKRVIELIEEMVPLIGAPPPPLPGDHIHRAAYVWLDAPDSSLPGEESAKDPEHIYLIGEDGEIRRISHVDAQTRGWADAYIQTHDLGYVFAPAELAHFVFAASRIAAYEIYQAATPELAAYHAKQNMSRLHGLEDKLLAAGFYKSIPPTTRPVAKALRMANTSAKIEKVVDRFHGYQGPSQPLEDGNLVETVLTSERVAKWLKQFDGGYADCALVLVENLRLVGRLSINEALNAFLDSPAGESFKDGIIVPIGQPKDGSSNVAYYARDVGAGRGLQVLALSDALPHARPLIMVDDFIGRGSSTISIMQACFGTDSTEQLSEARPDPLDAQAQERLRSAKVAFLYSGGMDWWQDGNNDFMGKLHSLGLVDPTVFVHLQEDRLPLIRTIPHPGITEPRWAKFVAYCEHIGDELLAATSEDKRKDRVLGYGNRGVLVATPYNTPTASLTCLWADGLVDGWPWEPLLPRLKKI